MLHCRSVAQLQIVCRLRGCLCSKCHSSCFLMHACHLHSSYLHPERSTFKARPRTVPCCCWCERQLSSLLAASESRPFSEFTTLVDDDIGAAGADVYILTSRPTSSCNCNSCATPTLVFRELQVHPTNCIVMTMIYAGSRKQRGLSDFVVLGLSSFQLWGLALFA